MIDEIRQVACVGSGLVGQGWAALFALNGYKVILQDLTSEKLEEAILRINHHIDVLVDAKLGSDSISAKKRISKTTNLEQALKETNFVIESVYESLEVKCPLYARMDRIAKKDAILASSTSGFMMSDINREMSNPERAIVTHPWNPVHLVPLVELSPSPKTNKETIDLTYRLMEYFQ